MYYLSYYDGVNAKCCEYGTYYDNETCVDIPIDNCEKYIVNKKECSQCKDEYVLKNNSKLCCKYDEIYLDHEGCVKSNESNIQCEDGKYLSNDHCCDEEMYWNMDMNRCVYLLDENCL